MTGKRHDVAFGTGLALLAAAVAVGLAIQAAAAPLAAGPQDVTPGSPAEESSPGAAPETPDGGNGTASTTGLGDGDDGTGVTLAEGVRTQQRGDVVELTFEFHGRAREARVTLGSVEAVGYEVRFGIRDGDGDGEVVVRWNTATSDAPDAGLAVQHEGSGWDEDAFTRGPRVIEGTSDPVEPATYPVSVVRSDTGTETDLGTVSLEERSATDLTVHAAPASVPTFETVSAVEQAAATAGADATVAVGERASDWVILRLDASGLSGQVDAAADLDGAVDGLTLAVEEADATVGPNEAPVRMRLDGNATLLSDGPHDRYYLAFRASELIEAGAEVGDRFTATFAADERNAVTGTNETLSTTFSLVDGRASVDLEAGELLAGATEEARVTGTTTWAPGTELLVQLHGSGGPGNATTFTDRAHAVVARDGTWTATFDLSDGVAGQAVDAMVFHGNSSVMLADAPGELGRLRASVEFDSQVAADDGTLVVVDSVTLERGGFVAVHDGGPGGQVIGVSDYLEPGTHEDVRIRLDVNATVTNRTRLAAVAHADADGNRQFGFVVTDGEVDRPYTDHSFPVAAVATVYAEAQLESEEQQ